MTADEQALCERCAHGTGVVTTGMADAARRHRLHLVLASGLSLDERKTPHGVRLARELTVAAGLDAWQEEATRDLLDSLGAAGIGALLLKGTGLAHTVYSEPYLRPRVDVDILITRESLAGAEQVLAARGWTHPPEPERELSAAQRHYVKPGPGALRHHADLHWSVANPRAFAQVMTYDALASRAVHVPSLGPFARTLALTDALVLACVHRVAHHDDAIDLLWLWDIHLLIGRFSPDDAPAVVARAAGAGTLAVCARGVQLAAELFGLPAAAALAASLEAARVNGPAEATAQFLGGTRAIAVFRADLATLPWPARMRLAREHLFPPRTYMRTRYPGWPGLLLPLAYLVRIARGAPGWFRRDAGGR